MIKIGDLEIFSAALAPMAGFTDSAFREICREIGAGLVISEMISAKALCFDDKKTYELLKYKSRERPFAFQLFGGDCDSMARAADKLCRLGPDLIDINMGCPVPKIVGSGSGSALLLNQKLAGDIVSAVKKNSSLPVSVKIRIGWDENSICAVDFAKRLEDSGADLITVHGRTRSQMYTPGVNLDQIAAVKAAINIPVIANGDITSYADAVRVSDYTKCDGIMIGRAAIGNPFIFRELADGDSYSPVSFSERMKNLRRLCALSVENKGERLACLELRRHLPFFFKGIRGASEIRREVTTITSISDLDKIIEKALKVKSEEGVYEA